MGVSGGYGAESGQLLTISCVNIIWTDFQFPRFLRDQEGGGGRGCQALDRGLGLGGPPPSWPSPLMTGLGCLCGPPAPSPPRGQTGPPRDRQTDTHTHTQPWTC